MDNTDFIREYFADSDSDEEFLGFTEEDLVDREVSDNQVSSDDSDSDQETETVPSGYDHTWLMDNNPNESGPKHLSETPTELDIMRLFLGDEFLDPLATETNRYAEQYLQSNTVTSPYARANRW